MATINMLRFNDHSGAIMSDEESWHLRMRRTYFGDNIHLLLPESTADGNGVELIYGGVGRPSFDFEVVQRCSREFEALSGSEPGSTELKSVGGMASKVLEIRRLLMRRRIDDRLKFLYGFDSDELNKGSFSRDGVTYEIKQEEVRSSALKTATFKDNNPQVRNIYRNHAVVMGYDKEDGLTAYCLKGEDSVLSFVSGGYECLGSGKYASGMSFARYLNNKTLAQRREGFDKVEGIVELITASLDAQKFARVGGVFSIVYLNGSGATRKERITELDSIASRLACETVTLYRAGFLSREDTYRFIDDLVFGALEPESLEDDILGKVTDPKTVRLFLRGYKTDVTHLAVAGLASSLNGGEETE